MRTTTLLIFMLLAGTAGCSGDPSLQAAFKKQMKDDGAAGFDIIHVEENENDGLVLYTSWTEEYPENKNRPGIQYFERPDQRWERTTGMGCSSNGVSRLGLMGNGYLFCSVLKERMNFEKIRTGDREAELFEFADGKRVWYAVDDDRDAKTVGITGDGREVALN